MSLAGNENIHQSWNLWLLQYEFTCGWLLRYRRLLSHGWRRGDCRSLTRVWKKFIVPTQVTFSANNSYENFESHFAVIFVQLSSYPDKESRKRGGETRCSELTSSKNNNLSMEIYSLLLYSPCIRASLSLEWTDENISKWVLLSCLVDQHLLRYQTFLRHEIYQYIMRNKCNCHEDILHNASKFEHLLIAIDYRR